jgi:tetratricopeptide (TPR) repeat protein
MDMRSAIAILICGLAAATGALAATPEEAARLFEARDWKRAAAAYQELVAGNPGNASAWLRLASARAAGGETDQALETLKSWAAAGPIPYHAVMAAPELKALHANPRFTALMEPLRPCSGPEFRQFDFWLGEWNVKSQASTGPGSQSRITRINGGCTILEQYTTPLGYEGTSLNFYDAQRKVWHQTWIDNQGGALYLEGGLDGESMVLATTSSTENIQRITWTPLEDGRVRQHWESTTDAGKTWSTVFDGYYSRT